MESTNSSASIAVLQSMVNEVLVHTGKVFKASRKNGQSGNTQAYSMIQSRLPETISKFHSALDDLEGEILDAKSVIMRDLDHIRAINAPPPPTQRSPEEAAQTAVVPESVMQKSPDEPSVPEVETKSNENGPVKSAIETEAKPSTIKAPFPDMGAGLGDDTQPSQNQSLQALNLQKARSPTPTEESFPIALNEKTTPPTQIPSGGLVGESISHERTNNLTSDSALELEDQGFNFTDMEFTVDPSANEPSQQLSIAQKPFDLSAMPSASDDTNQATLDSLLAANSPTKPEARHQSHKREPAGDVNYPETTEDQADGMDFDFGLENEEFNDYMNVRDDNFDIDNNDFNTAFYGLEGNE